MKRITKMVLGLAGAAALALTLAVPAHAVADASVSYARGASVDTTNTFIVYNTGDEPQSFTVTTDDGEVVQTGVLGTQIGQRVEFPRDYPETVTVTDEAGNVVATTQASRYDASGNRFIDIVTGKTVSGGVVKKEF